MAYIGQKSTNNYLGYGKYYTATKFTCPADGTISSIFAQIRAGASDTNYQFGVYTDSSGPDALVINSASGTVTGGSGTTWLEIAVTETSLSNGVDYWLVAQPNNALSSINLYGGGGPLKYTNSFSFPDWSDPFALSTSQISYQATMYADIYEGASADAQELAVAVKDPSIITGGSLIVDADAIDISSTISSFLVYNPTPQIAGTATPTAPTQSSASLSMDQTKDKTIELSNPADQDAEKKTITANIPIIFSDKTNGDPVVFHDRTNNNPIIFHLRQAVVAIVRSAKFFIDVFKNSIQSALTTSYTIGKTIAQTVSQFTESVGSANITMDQTENQTVTDLTITEDTDTTDDSLEPTASQSSGAITMDQTKSNTTSLGTSYTTGVS